MHFTALPATDKSFRMSAVRKIGAEGRTGTASVPLEGGETGSISSTSYTTGELKAKSGAMSYVTKDRQTITVQKTAGAVDRISAKLHWIRILGVDSTRYIHFLGPNV